MLIILRDLSWTERCNCYIIYVIYVRLAELVITLITALPVCVTNPTQHKHIGPSRFVSALLSYTERRRKKCLDAAFHALFLHICVSINQLPVRVQNPEGHGVSEDIPPCVQPMLRWVCAGHLQRGDAVEGDVLRRRLVLWMPSCDSCVCVCVCGGGGLYLNGTSFLLHKHSVVAISLRNIASRTDETSKCKKTHISCRQLTYFNVCIH